MRKYRIDIIYRYLDVSSLNLQPFRSQTYRYQIDYLDPKKLNNFEIKSFFYVFEEIFLENIKK